MSETSEEGEVSEATHDWNQARDFRRIWDHASGWVGGSVRSVYAIVTGWVGE